MKPNWKGLLAILLMGKLTPVAAALTACFSMLALGGWAVRSLQFFRFDERFIPMAPATAVCLLAASAALLCRRWWPHRSRLVHNGLSGGIFIYSTAVFLQFVATLGWNLTWDLEGWLVPAVDSNRGFIAGRMSPLTALLFILLATSLLLSHPRGGMAHRHCRKAQIAALAIWLSSFVLITGYLYGAPLLYGGRITPVAPSTAACFLLLATALLFEGEKALFSRWVSSTTVFGRFTRLMIPGLTLIILVAGWLGLAFLIRLPPVIQVLCISSGAMLAAGLAALLTLLAARQVQAAADRAGQALRASEERFAALFNQAPLGYQSLDTEGRFLEVNQAWLETLGYRREEVIGRWFGDFLAPEFVPGFLERFPRFKAEGKIHSEFQMLHKSGVRRYIAFEGRIGCDALGQFKQTHCILSDITGQRQAERELSNAYRLFESVILQSPIPMAIAAPDGALTIFNDACVEQLGLSHDTEIKRGINLFKMDIPWQDFDSNGNPVPLDQLPLVLALQGQTTRSREIRVVRKDGTERWEIVNAVPIVDEDGKLIAGFVAFPDITALKRAEEALEKRVVALTRPLEDAGGVLFEDLFNLADLQRLQDDFSRATGVASSITRIDGTPITLPSNFSRLCGSIIRPTKKGQLKCAESDASIGRFNPAGPTIQICSSAGLWMAGAAISVGGRHIANWLIGQVRDTAQTEARMREYAREIEADEELMIEAFREVPAMSREQFENVARVLFTLANQFSAAAYQNVQQARFITEHKRTAKEKEKLQEQLLQAQKMESVGRLAGGVAHDFNNMLSVILGHTEMVLEQIGTGHPLHADLTEIQKAARRSADLTRQLLAFARKQTVTPEVLNLNDTVTGMLKMLRRLIGEDIHLTWNPGPDMWPVRIDPAQVDQIMANLCVNARDAISGVGRITINTGNVPAGGAESETRPGSLPGDFVMISVTDDGCGMEKEVLAHLFEPFFSTKQLGRGTGLGLATVYGIVKQNNGFIKVNSTPGQGTSIEIYLPRQEGELTAEAAGFPLLVRPGRGETILLVEDDPSLLKMSRSMLARLHYHVLAANSPEKAIRLARSHPGEIRLLLTDVVMPGMNGRELACEIKTAHPQLKCLFMSGYPADIIAHRGILEDGVKFIAKPFNSLDLSVVIREVIETC